MGLSNKHRFYSKIDDRNALSFLYDLDYSISQSKDRIELVDEKIKESVTYESYVNDYNEEYIDTRNWFEKYTDDFYNPFLRTGSDALAHENSVFGVLERLGSYILWSEDNKKAEKAEKYVYKYYDDEEKFLYNVRKREKAIEGFVTGVVGSECATTDDVIHYLSQFGRNYKKKKDVVITGADLKKDTYCGEVLRQYDELIEIIRREAKTTESYRHKRAIQALMPSIRTDMLTSKYQLNGMFDSNNNKLLADSTEINWEAIDYYDIDTLKALIQFCKGGIGSADFQEDKQCIIYDFTTLVKKAVANGKISKPNTKVMNLFSQGMTTEQIGNLLGKSKQAVRTNLNTICNGIIKQYEEDIEDWIYTFHRKGDYKTCSKCGEVKLVSKFSKQASNRGGVRTYCKQCESGEKKLKKLKK